MSYLYAVVVALVLVWLIICAPASEGFTGELRFSSISSSSPVPYGIRPIGTDNGYHIRRWRTAIPQTGDAVITDPNWSSSVDLKLPPQRIVPRQLHDDEWARTYDSGIGFQLG